MQSTSVKSADLECPQHTHPHRRSPCEVMGILVGLTVVNVLSCVLVTKHHFVHLKYMQFLIVNYTSIRLENTSNFLKTFLRPKLMLGWCPCLLILHSPVPDGSHSLFGHGHCPASGPEECEGWVSQERSGRSLLLQRAVA